jgi:DNA polymerase-3 subunit delta
LTAGVERPYFEGVSPSELGKEIEAGRFRPIYYFYGTEDYRIKEAEKAVVAGFLPRPQQTTNHIILSAAKSRLEDVLTELSTIPMLGDRQIFTIGEIQSLQLAQIEKIIDILTPPDASRIVILTSPSARMPRKGSKTLRFLESEAVAVEFSRLPALASTRKIKAIAREHGVEIEPEAMAMLVELGGGNMGGIVSEMNKLIDYVGKGGTIKKEDVTAATSDYQAFKIYELADRAAAGDFDKTLSIMDFLLLAGERATGLLFWLGEHFVGLYLTKNRKSVGAGRKDQSWKYRNQVDLFENEQLEKIIKYIAKADFDVRSGLKPERIILEKLLYKICYLNKKTTRG